jgi:FMN phosphatase YigB (HAD superfamily)
MSEILVSFDIFDTTLLRRGGKPQTVWDKLSKRLYPEYEDMQEAFLKWRINARGETLLEIYSHLDSTFLSLARKNQDEFIQAEKDEEAAALTVNPSIKKVILDYRSKGCQIAFISDMYLDSLFLRTLLIREECAEPEDPIYVSCELGARKDTGTLYELVRKELQPEQWIHYGDNVRSDIRMSRHKGIKAYYVNTELNAVEKACRLTNIVLDTSRLVAFSRLYRLQHQDNEFAAFAADFIVPAYLPYVFFVLEKARRLGLRKLYFLSRDSYIFYKAALAMHNIYDGIELHYLFVSRRSLFLPYMYGQGKEAFLALTTRNTLVNYSDIDHLLQQFGTTRQRLLYEYGIEFPYLKISNIQEQNDFLHKIFDTDFAFDIQKMAKQQYDLLIRYFESEGVLDGSPSATVDLGWFGTSRLMMNQILHRHGDNDVVSFYYGIRDDVLPPSAGRYFTYFRHNEPIPITLLLEQYYSASPYPTTIGYIETADNRVVPQYPKGKDFLNTPLTLANEDAIMYIARMIVDEGLVNDSQLLKCWAERAINVMQDNNIRIDLTPLSKLQFLYEDQQSVRVLSISEQIKLLSSVNTMTIFDLLSLKMSIPWRVWKLIWHLREIKGNIRKIGVKLRNIR